MFKVKSKDSGTIQTVFAVRVDENDNTLFLFTVGEWYWSYADGYDLYTEGLNHEHI